MTTEEKAYIAGIIDGEGTVTLTSDHKGELPAPKVSIANNDLALLNWIKEKAGSGVIITRSKRQPHHGEQYVLDFSNNSALALLSEVEGYLRIKKPQARLLLSGYKTVTPRNGKYTGDLLAAKMRLVAEIRSLNRH